MGIPKITRWNFPEKFPVGDFHWQTSMNRVSFPYFILKARVFPKVDGFELFLYAYQDKWHLASKCRKLKLDHQIIFQGNLMTLQPMLVGPILMNYHLGRCSEETHRWENFSGKFGIKNATNFQIRSIWAKCILHEVKNWKQIFF